MKKVLITLLTIVSFGCQAEKPEKYNLGFENQKKKTNLSDGWFKWGNYDLTIDTLSHSGKKSGKITSDHLGNSFGSIVYKIPANYKGKSIRLEGYMKIQNVENGYAGLLLRIDGKEGSLAFDNMQSQNIKGTKDWQKYSITLSYPEEAETIFVAGILTGKGEAWFDEFVVTIDEKNLQNLKETKKELSKAQLDKEFDNGSLIVLSNLTAENIDKLVLLGRVWGFLKYYHPQIAKGNYNWDYELFRFLPKYFNSKGNKERNNLIINWIDSLGQLRKCSYCKPTAENVFIKPDLKWIENQDETLKKELLYVYNNRSQGKHYYIGMAPNVGNPDFKNENIYPNMPYPDDGFRLLSLFRYWNMINYFFPYKHLMDKDWNLALEEYIPIFCNAKNELEYELAVLQLLGEVQDTHANLRGGHNAVEYWKGKYFPPVHLGFVENQLTVLDYYNPELKEKVGLEIGDIITKINGKIITEIVEEKRRYYPASNEPTRLRDLSSDILRSNEKVLNISFIRNKEEENKTLALYERDSLNIYQWYRMDDEPSFKILDDNIGYITLKTIRKKDIQVIKDTFKTAKGIIIDIRNYPSTFVTFLLGSFFVKDQTPFVKLTIGNINNPGEFSFSQPIKIYNEHEPYRGKLVVLVNELTQSQAEYTAMAFRSGVNTTIIGSTTAGADGDVSTIFLPGGLRTMISGIGVNYPNGEETQRVGIVPDVVVKPTIEGIKQGRDELLEKAIEIIMKD